METIKLLLAHSDRKVSNLIEVAVLDVCYDLAAVQATRISRLDEFVRQGTLWDFDLIVVGGENLYLDKSDRHWASAEAVAAAIETIRVHRSTPLLALSSSPEAGSMLLEAGADSVQPFPFSPDRLKSELRGLLDLDRLVEAGESKGWPRLGAILRGFQKAQ